MLPNLSRQTKNELDTRLTPRVIDRLRLRTLHNCKIRCTLQESLPMARRLNGYSFFFKVRTEPPT